MIQRKFRIYLLMAALLPTLAVAMPSPKAYAKDGRNAAFAAGLAAGAIGGAALATANSNAPRRYYRPAPPPPPRYYRPAPPRYYRPAPPPPPRYYARPAPWSRAWFDYCYSKYRSFEPQTGYYTTYSGRKRFCR